jgi:hypothetical protein
MNTDELKEALNRQHLSDDPNKVVINVSKPSIGPIATCEVSSASYGFDWERGLFILSPAQPLVPKSEKEELWDLAYDFIYSLSEEKTYKGNETSLAKRAKKIIDRSKEVSNKQ